MQVPKHKFPGNETYVEGRLRVLGHNVSHPLPEVARSVSLMIFPGMAGCDDRHQNMDSVGKLAFALTKSKAVITRMGKW